MEYAAILFLLKARRRPLRTIEATEFKHIFPVGAGNGEAVVHSPPDSPARAAGYTKVCTLTVQSALIGMPVNCSGSQTSVVIYIMKIPVVFLFYPLSK